MKPVGPVHRESRDGLSLPSRYRYGTAISSPTAWAVRRSAPSSTELAPETRRNPLQRYSEHSPNDSVRRQAIHQGPCRTLAYVFSELHTTDIGALFFLYIPASVEERPSAIRCNQKDLA